MAQPGAFRIDPRYLPTLNSVEPETDKPGLISSGLLTGLGEAGSIVGAAAQGVGNLFDIAPLEVAGQQSSQAAAGFAQRHSRPDLEIAPWEEGGAPIGKWLGYQTLKQLPQLAAYIGAGAAVPEAAVPAALARIGASVPRVLGGGGLRAGADFAARRAALKAGADYGRTAIGVEAAGTPLAFGSQIQEADQKEGGLAPGEALRAAVQSPLYAALDIVEPAQLKGLLSKGLKGNIVKRIATAGLVGAAAEVPQEAVQTAMELSFRPDMSNADKFEQIIDAALTGGAVGGVFGGVGGLRRMKPLSTEASSQEIGSVVDQAISGLLTGPPDFVSDAAGRTVPGANQGEDVLRSTPIGPNDTDAQFRPNIPQGQPAIESSTVIQPKQGSLRWAKDYPQQDLSRPFVNNPTEELRAGLEAAQRRIDAGTANENILRTAQMLEDELVNRSETETGAQGSVEAVQRGQTGGGPGLSAAPVSATPANDIDALIGPVKRVPASVQAAMNNAGSANELVEIAHREVIQSEKGGKWREELGKRTGLLDNEGKPTALADEISKSVAARQEIEAEASVAPEQAAPANLKGGDQTADAEFQEFWKKATHGVRDPAVHNISPSTKEDAQLRVYRALGNYTEERDVGDDISEKDLNDRSALERIAQMPEIGILDENKQLTPLAKEMAKRDPIPTQEAVKAAIVQGYKGAHASMFERGVRSFLGRSPVTKFDSFEEMGAYRAGQAWAEERNSIPRGVLKAYDPSGFTGDVTDEELALGRGSPVKVTKAAIPPEQEKARWINQAIDEKYAGNPDIAELKRMAQEGESPDDIDEVARYFASGRGPLLRPNLAPPSKPYTGEPPAIRGAPRMPKEGAPVKHGRKRAQELIQSQEAIRRHQERQAFRERLQDLVDEVNEEFEAEQEISAKELKIDKAGRLKANPMLKAWEPDPDLEKLVGKDRQISVRSALKYLVASAPNAGQRELANKLNSALQRMSRDGYKLNIFVSGKTGFAPPEMATSNALTIANDDGTIEIWLNDASMGRRVGINYTALAHEMVHAVTTLAVDVGINSSPDTPVGAAARELVAVRDRIWAHLSSLPDNKIPPLLQEFLRGGNNALTDEDEIMAWALTDPDMQAYLKTVTYAPQQSLWQKLVQAIGRLFGLEPGSKGLSALEEVMTAAEKLMANTLPVQELQRHYMMRAERESVTLGTHRSPVKTNAVVQDTIQRATAAADQFAAKQDLRGKAIDAQLYVADNHHITENFAKLFQATATSNPLRDLDSYDSQRVSITTKMTQSATNSDDAYRRLYRTDRAQADKLTQLQTATEFPYDPTRPWKDQTKDVQDQAKLKPSHQMYHDIWRGLKEEARSLYADLRSVNDAQYMAYHATLLHSEIMANPQIADALKATIHNGPVDRYLAEPKDFTPAEARAWWAKTVSDMQVAISNHIKTLEHGKDAAGLKALRDQFASLRERMGETAAAVHKIEQKPYFHLPRFGEYFVDFKVRDQEALAKIADALDGQGFGGVISKDSDQNHVFMRFENVAMQSKLFNLIEGYKSGPNPLVTESETGMLSEERYSARILDRGIQRMIQGIEGNPDLDKDAKDAALASLRKTSLDLMPENSIARVMTERKGVPGYSADMMRGFAQRTKIGADSLADMVLAPKVAEAFTAMRKMTREVQKVPGFALSVEERNTMQKVTDERSRRIRERAEWTHNKMLDMLSKVTSAHYLGLSPAFAFVQFTQLGATTLPELGSQYGFAKSMGAMASATPLALRIMREVFQGGKDISLTRAMDAVITRKSLNVSGVSQQMAEFLMHPAVNSRLNTGGQIRELVRAAEGQDSHKLDTALRYASAMGYYSETLTRLIAAIATYKLNPNSSAEEVSAKASRVLDESLFDFSPDNWGRLFGRKGFLGAATPLATKFMQYSAQLIGKLYREVNKAFFDGATSQEEKDQARRFLMGHLASMTVMAGTLGLPMVTVFAAAFDTLKDLFDDDEKPSDIRSAFRQYLALTVGNEVEPYLSKGVFRVAGVDLTSRIGEQDLIPFSRFFGDRRSIKDRLSDLQSRSWGAPTSMVASYAKGIGRISDGDVLGGMIAALPIGLANPLKAFRMEDTGRFVDASGKELPVEPNVKDVMAQAMGFNPGQNADYSERRGADQAASGQLGRRATVLRDQMVDAMIDHDDDAMKDIAKDIIKFDRANPDRPSIMGSIKSSYKRRIMQQAIAGMTKQPLGVKPGAGDYTFGDIDYAR